ncbi:LLM class flavin-dependent oxidoreductase [Natrialba asiatica]|uniref:Luciferase-like protein n=1 Tax=Natrialba asiatica (strain ATCC 700177 / DSM 12278 / JCM 9576 / FERM P-10747 / NBRC 102637 / 172P1) TaxID=29540 RepID=M0AGQ6_NATA1|nr:LLM class flavin-dependent oxidoreductase [Natrialba asiatica]ELY97067.1 luciferase-like protein [Natrialba asiatica DSM 12278]
MKIGFRCTEGGQRFDEALTEVRRAEEFGFDSAWVAEHHGWDAKWPNSYIALAGFAAATDEIEFGTGVTILPQTNPVSLAGAANLVDVVSDGRFILGVGTGWRRDEMENLGYDFESRGPRMTDHLCALNELWEPGPSSYDGRFVSFEEFDLAPESIRDPRPPIWVGGGSTPALKRAACLGDAWLPSWREPFDALEEKYATYESFLDDADGSNRSVPLLRIACIDEDGDVAREKLRTLLTELVESYRAKGSTVPEAWVSALEGDIDEFAQDLFVYGTPSECAAQLERYREAFGVDHAVLRLATPTTDHEDVMEAVDLFGRRVIPDL